MENPWFEFVLAGLAIFRLTRLFVYDQITELLRKPFMDEVEEKNAAGETDLFLVPKEGGFSGWMGALLSCYWCTGVWVSMFLFIIRQFAPMVYEPILLIFAAAGMAALIETIVQRIMVD